jgi:hypothetical protein
LKLVRLLASRRARLEKKLDEEFYLELLEISFKELDKLDKRKVGAKSKYRACAEWGNDLKARLEGKIEEARENNCLPKRF